MRADRLILGGWALLVLVQGAVALFFERLPALLLAWAALIVAGLLAYIVLRRPGPESTGGGDTRFVPDLSPQTVLLAFGIAALVSGIYAGYWLSLIGAGFAALAVWNLRREGR